MKYIILLVLAICTYSSYAQNVTNMNVTTNMNITNMNITDANITSVFGKGKAGKKKNATISPLSEKFCTSKEVDPKKKDLCYSAQFVMVESEKYFTKLKELEQPQKIYTDLREETVQALQRATAAATAASTHPWRASPALDAVLHPPDFIASFILLL